MDTDSPQGIGMDEAQKRIALAIDPATGSEDGSDEADAWDGADEYGDADADGLDGEEQPRYLVKVDGEDHEVTLDELVHGYSRQADYTRKTQKLAEAREAIMAEREQLADVHRERAEYAALLSTLRQSLEEAPEEPDWDSLFAQDPAQASALKQQWDGEEFARQRQAMAVRAEQERVLALAQQAQQDMLERHLHTEASRLPEIIPAWRDQRVAETERQQILHWALDQGLSPQDLEGVTRADVVGILRKAWLYDNGRRKAEAAIGGAQPTLRPGASARGAPDLTRQKQRLAKTGRVADAAKIIQALL
ncbi:hypothetical protein [Iodidimonas sp. SYSU 1G8]|uniref:hypothetical protein n=1 Tax=Iodidimonas sp. SYSU 1G8 TaxID=3133967 RepID=UPI0031FE6D3E